MVHLLEGATASFRNAEVRPDKGEDTEHREEDVRAVACIIDQRRRNEALILLVSLKHGSDNR